MRLGECFLGLAWLGKDWLTSEYTDLILRTIIIILGRR